LATTPPWRSSRTATNRAELSIAAETLEQAINSALGIESDKVTNYCPITASRRHGVFFGAWVASA
jgi:hypothetical protein